MQSTALNASKSNMRQVQNNQMLGKKFLQIFLIGGLGGLVFVFLAVLFLRSFNTRLLASIFNVQTSSLGAVAVIQGELEDRKNSLSLPALKDENHPEIKRVLDSVVAIRTYQQGKLIRSGSGLVVTQDGLIITAEQVVPEGELTYKVMANGKIFEGTVVKRDPEKNIALLKIEDFSLLPIVFDLEEALPGANFFLLGKIFSSNQVVKNFVSRVLVRRAISPGKFILDGRYENYLAGAGVVSPEGKFWGLVSIDGQRILALQSNFLKDFIRR